jgi:hypothetical protein
MIDPISFLASEKQQEDDQLTEIEGSFGCPEQGCYETTTVGKFDSSTRVVIWTCVNGHNGKASL